MKIAVKRSGGYAGVREDVATIDTAKLTATAVEQLEQMLQGIGFFDLPAIVSPETVGADMFYYEIAVTEDHRQHTVAFYDDNSPQIAPLRKLVDTLIRMA